RIGFIIGGQPFHPALRYADFVLAESEQQANGIRNFFERSVPVNVLCKYVNWPLAKRLYVESRIATTKKYDIVTVGRFEAYKNQIELQRFFGRYRIAMIGDGPCLEAVRSAAAGNADVTFFGAIANDAVLRVIAESRLTVHPSLS